MRILLPAAAALLVISHSVLAQVQKPSPTPDPTAVNENEVVKISTNLIQIDVTVTDPKGNIIRDLKQSEIEIFENGVKQDISNFSFISSQQRHLSMEPGSVTVQPPQGPPGNVRPEQIFRTIALVVDDLNLSSESVHFTKRTLKRFVEEQMQDGDLVAIVKTGTNIGSLQNFTRDKRMLLAAIDKIKWNPVGTGGVTAFTTIERFNIEAVVTPVDTDLSEEEAAIERNRIAAFNDFRSGHFAAGTLGGLQFVVRGISELPGRKSIILFSDGFRLFERDRDGTPRSRKVMEYLQQLVDLANRSSIVFYPIDARGLAFTGLTAADDTRLLGAGGTEKVISMRKTQLFETQAGLTYLARETGGFAVINTNDLSGGVGRALDDQSYYLIGYEPAQSTFQPANLKYNKIEVKVLRKDAMVRYRSGFFNVVGRPDARPRPSANATPAARLEAALHSPFSSSGIAVRLNSLFGTAAPGGPYVRSLLHVDANDLIFTDTADGKKEAAFDVLATCFGDNGELVDQIGRRYSMALTPDVYKRILAEGFVYHFKFPVKKPGAYQYRVAISDSKGEKIGTASQFLQVPDVTSNLLSLSSIVVENLTPEQYDRSWELSPPQIDTDPMTDTALRRVRSGSVLRYSFEIYNARFDPTRNPRLKIKTRVFREGKLVHDSPEKPFELHGQTDLRHLRSFGAIAIGRLMEPGDYVLEIVVTDALAPEKNKATSQVVNFEVYD
ncbi:MAG TPA: VWA domain-containing protein [Pyrinomonadaceae bacterium]|nr:VWA domain-containing protein [Pyrinomonadaceae bacterium]